MIYATLIWKFLKNGGAVAVLLIALLVLYSMYEVRGYQLKNLRQENKIALAKAETEFQKKAREIEQKNYQEVINAINEATSRKIQIDIDNANAIAADKRLSNTIDTLNREVSKLSENARIEYTTALADVLKECTARYTDVAKKADGHANDVQMMRQIWKETRQNENSN